MNCAGCDREVKDPYENSGHMYSFGAWWHFGCLAKYLENMRGQKPSEKQWINWGIGFSVTVFILAMLISGILTLGLAMQPEKPHKIPPLIPKIQKAYS